MQPVTSGPGHEDSWTGLKPDVILFGGSSESRFFVHETSPEARFARVRMRNFWHWIFLAHSHVRKHIGERPLSCF